MIIGILITLQVNLYNLVDHNVVKSDENLYKLL